MTAKAHNSIIVGIWILVIGGGLIWLYNRNQKGKAAAAAAVPKPVTTAAPSTTT